ncbi:MAG TPA: AsmA family protein [Stellaceae bacterium]
MARVWTGFHRHPIWTGISIFIGFLIVLAFAWNWNWLRPVVARKIADELQRPVTLQYFDVENALSAQPTLVLDGIAIGNPPDFPEGTQTGTIDELRVSFDLRALASSFGKKIIVSQLIVQHPEGDLRPGPKGNPNWTFPVTEDSSGNTIPPRIGSLIVTDGDFRFADPRLKADLRVKVRTQPADQKHEQQIMIDATGTYGGQPINGHFVGGSVLALRNSDKPYPVELTAQSGDTRVHLAGTIDHPEQLSGANLQLELQGQDLADLYKLLDLPLAPSPPYSLRGHLDYDKGRNRISFKNFTGRVGESDLAGDLAVDRVGDRPRVTGDLTSHNVRMADLGGFIGAPPGREAAPTEGPKQRAEHAAQEAKPTLLPDTAIDLNKIRSTDYRVHYRGEHVVTDWAPLDHIEGSLTIENGDIKVEPLDFAVGSGTISSKIELDGRVDPIQAKADIDFRHVDLQRVLQNVKFAQGVGVIGGHWAIEGTGNSLARILAHSNGDLKLFMGNGDLSAIVVNAAGLDVGGTLASLLGLPTTAKINCLVSDFALKNGVLDTRALVLDTDQGNVYGKGNIDLRDEGIAYQISEEGKHISVGALHAPIDITGSFKDPHVKPEPGALAARIGIAAAIGAVFPPAGLLATIQLGLGKDHNCGALIAAAQNQQPVSSQAAGPTTGAPNAPAILPSGAAEPNPGPAANSSVPQEAQAPIATPEPKRVPPPKPAR